MNPHLLSRSLGKAIDNQATPLATASGCIFLPDTEIALQELFAPYVSEDEREALAYDDGSTLRRILESCACRPRALVEYRMVSHPTGWISGLGVFEFDDRGYIFYDGEPDTRLNNPILGAWQPYDDRETFAACLIAAYERFLAEYLLVAERMMIRSPDTMTTDLLYEALLAGLNRHPDYWSVVNDYLAANLPPTERAQPTNGHSRHSLPTSDLLRRYQPPPASGGRHERLQRFCDLAVTVSPFSD